MFRALKTHQFVVDVVVAVLLLIVTLPWTLYPESIAYPAGSSSSSVWSALPIALILCAALAIRRLGPGLALALAWVAALAQMALGLPPLPVDLAVFGVLYAAAAYGSRVVLWAGLASAFLAAAFISLYIVVPPLLRDGRSLLDALGQFVTASLALYVATAFALLLAWAAGALVRTAVRARENRAAQQRAEAETVAEQERVRIARDMHDVVAHSLAVVIAQADGARYAAASDPAGPGGAVAAEAAESTQRRGGVVGQAGAGARRRRSGRGGGSANFGEKHSEVVR